MRIISSLIATLFAGTLAAQPMGLDHFTLVDGRVLTVEQLSFEAELSLDGETLWEDAQIELFDAGDAGVLVQTWHGGNSCPFSYMLIDKATGAFREINPDSDRSTIFAECEGLVSVIPELATILMKRYDTRNMSKVARLHN